jgi:hypothetical protein
MSSVKCLLAAAFVAGSVACVRGQVTFTFTGTVNPDWFNPSNWTVGGLPTTQIPGPKDDVIIGPGMVTAIASNAVTLNDLTLLNQGALDGSGNITVVGTFDFNSTVPFQNPRLSGSGTLINAGTMNVRGSCSLLRNVKNYGSNALLQTGGSGPANLLCATNVYIDNRGSGVISLEDTTILTGGARIENLGIIAKYTGTNTAYIGVSSSDAGPNIINHGALTVTSGTLSLWPANSSESFGAFTAGPNSVLFLHHAHFLVGGAAIFGAGICRSDGSIIANSGGFSHIGVDGTLELDSGGSIQPDTNYGSSGTFTFYSQTSRFLWQGGQISNEHFVFGPTALFEISGPVEKDMTACLITNQGLTEWRDAGYVVDQPAPNGPSQFVNSGRFVAYNDATFGSQSPPFPQFFNLAGGSFVKTLDDKDNPTGAGSGTTTIQDLECLGGTVQVASGTLSVWNGTLSNATLAVIDDSAALKFLSGYVNVTGNTSVTTTPAGEMGITGLQVMTLADSNVTLQISGNLNMFGEISGPGTLQLAHGNLYWNGGTIAVSNYLVDAASVTITTNTAGQGFLNCTVSNLGIFSIGGSIGLTGTQFNNAPGGQFDYTAPADLFGNKSTIMNAGVMEIPAGDQTAVEATIQNSGLININGMAYLYPLSFINVGTINVYGFLETPANINQTDGSCNLGSAGTIIAPAINLNGGLLTGSGPPGTYGFVGDVFNNSLKGVDPPWINGNYTSTSNGTVTIHIGGLTPVTQYDQFNITGSAALNGTLNVSLINGFVPTNGNQFTVMSFGSLSGTFAVKNGLNLGNGLVLLPVYSSTNLTLVATNAVLIQPVIGISSGSPPGTAGLSWSSILGQTYQIEFSPDLSHWFRLADLEGTGSSMTFTDTNEAAIQPAGFYRLR